MYYVRNYHDKKIQLTPTCDIRSTEKLFSAPYVACWCLPDFLVMVISNIIYQFLHSKLYNYISCP